MEHHLTPKLKVAISAIVRIPIRGCSPRRRHGCATQRCAGSDGRAEPPALAVLRLIVSSYLVGADNSHLIVDVLSHARLQVSPLSLSVLSVAAEETCADGAEINHVSRC